MKENTKVAFLLSLFVLNISGHLSTDFSG